jgi:alanyl-tRNA synthetase
VKKELAELDAVRALFKNPKQTAKSVAALQDENKALRKEIETLQAAQANALKGELVAKVEQINGVNFIGAKLPLNDSNTIKTLAYQLEKEVGDAVIVFGADINGKPQLSVTISRNLTESHDLHAGKIIKQIAREIKGGGGGQAFFATAGGKDASGLDAAVGKAREMLVV